MTYEVQFQVGTAEYTARGPDIDGVLRLIQGVQGVGRVSEWIDWAGGACPVASGVVVALQPRSGRQTRGEGQTFDWGHTGRPGDIVRYRVCE